MRRGRGLGGSASGWRGSPVQWSLDETVGAPVASSATWYICTRSHRLAIWKNEDSTWRAFPGSAPEAEIPSAPVGSDDCGAAFVQKHAILEIAASPTDQIQPCAHREVTTDESAECRRDPAPEAAKKKPRKVAKGAARKVPRQAAPKPPPTMPGPARSGPIRPQLAVDATSRSRMEPARSRPRRSVPEDDVLHAERQ